MTTPVVTKAVQAAAAGRIAPGGERGPGAPRGTMRARPAAPRTAAAPRPVAAKKAARGAPAKKTASRGRAYATRAFKPAVLSTPTGATKIVAAEYAACVVLIGAAPILTRAPDSAGHVYKANEFVRLSAVSLLFFILALLSAGPRTGRIAAAFGALVTLGVVFNARGAIAAVGQIFTAAKSAGGAVTTAAAGTTSVDAPTFTPVDLAANPLAQAGGAVGGSGRGGGAV